MLTEIWVNVGSDNGLLSDGFKPIPEPVLSNHQWGLVAFAKAFIIWHVAQKSFVPISHEILRSKLKFGDMVLHLNWQSWSVSTSLYACLRRKAFWNNSKIQFHLILIMIFNIKCQQIAADITALKPDMILDPILHFGQMHWSAAIHELIGKLILWQSSCLHVPLKTSFPLVQVFRWPDAFSTSIYSNLWELSPDEKRHYWTGHSKRQEHVQAISAHPSISDGRSNKMKASFHVVGLSILYTVYPIQYALFDYGK